MKFKHKSYMASLAFAAPALALFLMFVYYPFLGTLCASLTDSDGLGSSRFVGFANFGRLFTERSLSEAARNTGLYTAATLLIGNPLYVGLALALNRPLRTGGWLRTAYFVPQTMSVAVLATIWGAMLQYDGLLNGVLRRIGLSRFAADWLGNSATALDAMIAFHVWQSAGFGAVIALVGLRAIPREIIEAARLEGAEGWRLFRHVTLPLLRPALAVINFLLLAGGLNVFETPLMLTGGGPGSSTMTLSLLIYRIAFQYREPGYAAAAGAALFVLVAACALPLAALFRKEA